MLSLQDFLNQNTGKIVGNTPQNTGQCVGLASIWMDNLSIPHEWGNAIDFLANADPRFVAVIKNTPTNAPSAGDLVVFDFNHIAIVVSATIDTLTVFEQNDHDQNNPTGVCQMKTYNYSHVVGWLHPLTLSNTTTQAVTDAQLQDQLNKQIQATSACQTQVASLQEQNTKLQQQLNSLQTILTDVTTKYNADERTIINIKTQLSLINQEDADYAVKAFENEKLAAGYKSALVDLAETAGIEKDTPEDQLVALIKKKLIVRQTTPPPETVIPPVAPIMPPASSLDLLHSFMRLFIKP